jgi:hypothetical protein
MRVSVIVKADAASFQFFYAREETARTFDLMQKRKASLARGFSGGRD